MVEAPVLELLATPAYAHLAVVDDAGVPHVTPVWVDVDEGGAIWFNTAVGRFKDRHLAVGAPLALSAQDPENPYRYVMVRGRVAQRRLETAEADIDTLAEKYMGVDSYPLRKEGEVRVTVVIEPTSTVNYG